MAVSYAREEIPEPFLRLAEALEMPASPGWEEYRESFIRRWGRKPGQERWDMSAVNFPAEQQQKVYEALGALGMLSAWQPQREFYDYAILPGATIPTMKARLNWLIALWQKGVRFRQLVVLTGQRPLVDRIDRTTEVMGSLHQEQMPMHETEAFRQLIDTTSLPAGMETVQTLFFDSPRTWQDQRWERAHTGTTVEVWMEHAPEPGHVLLISTQPSAHYQDAVFRKLLPKDFSIDTSAPALVTNVSLAVVLDAVAIWLRSGTTPPPL